MAVEYDISSDVAVIKEVGSVSQCARVTQMYSGQITYDDEAGSKFATATINGKSQRVMLCIAVNGTVNYDDVPSLYSTVDGHRCLNIVTPTETGTPDDVPSLYETVVIDGQNVRAVRCIMINKTPVYDGVSSTCTFTGDDGKTHTAQLVNKVTGGSVVVIIKGTSPLVLPDAVDADISSLIAFGGTEQRNIPQPYTQVNYVTNTAQTAVDTGIMIDFAKNYEFEVECRAVSGSWYILQSRASSTGNITGIHGATSGSTITLVVGNVTVCTSAITRTLGNKLYVKATLNNGTATLYVKDETANTEDTQTGSYGTSQPNPTAAVYLLGNAGGQYVDVNNDIYMAHIKENGVTVMDYVPARQVATAGFYDKASGTFKTAETPANLSADGNTVPTPDAPMDIVCNNGVLKWDSVNETVYADGTQETINVHSKNLWNPDPTSYERFDVTASSTKRYGHTYRNGTYTVKQNGTGGGATIYLKIFSNGSYGTAQVITTARTVTVSGDDVLLVYSSSGTATDTTDYDIQVERGATATDYQPYFDCGSAVAEMLLAIGDDKDQQEIIDGTVTRKIGWHIFDGTESFGSSSAYGTALYMNSADRQWGADKTKRVVCTHFLGRPTASSVQNLYTCFFNSSGHFYLRTTETAGNFKAWLKDLYDAGTPMMLFFVRPSTRTDTVTAQPMATQQGDNVAEITQASLTGLELEAQYNAAVSLTIQEVQDANLDNNVTVTIQ